MLTDKLRIVELKWRLLSTATMLAEDEVYSREDAVRDIAWVVRQLDDMEFAYRDQNLQSY
ncbi:hypothetical protein [Sutcliffiella horikoshii]|uniref:hypothetical protein n=1 Tax=Sutcliffiella horikoshii TaxID=79883 RepID=UPI003CEF8172